MRYRLKPDAFPSQYLEDAERLVQVCKASEIEVSTWTAYHAWLRASDNWCASWLILRGFTDEEIVSMIMPFLVEAEDVGER